MASDLRAILGALRTTIAGVTLTSGGSLSATGKVRIGRPTPADGASPPMCWISEPSVKSERSAELGSYLRRATIDIELRVPTATSDTDEHALAACDALDDLTTALQADPSVGGRVLDSGFTGTAFDGAEAGLAGVAVAFIQWEGWWISTSSEGT